MRARVSVNLTKWESCKAFGETSVAFFERMTKNIDNHMNGLKRYYKELNKETDEGRREWIEGAIAYEERKIKRWQKEVAKAVADM